MSRAKTLVINLEKVNHFTQAFFSAKGETLKRLLDLAKVVAEASASLTPEEFKAFISDAQVGSLSTVKKLKSIGQRYALLSSYSNQLPSNWTTNYQISRIPEEVLEGLFQQGVITPMILAKQVEPYLPPSGRATKTSVKGVYAVEAPAKVKDEDKAIFLEFKTKLEGLGFRFRRLAESDSVTDVEPLAA